MNLQDRIFRNILVIRQSALGDVMNVLPILALLRERFPDARITCLTGPVTADLLRLDPCVDHVIEHRRSRRPANLLPALFRLRAARFDLVVDLQSSRYTRWLALATGASVRLGSRGGSFYTHPVRLEIGSKQVCYLFREILSPIGLDACPLSNRFPRLEDGREAARSLLAGLGLGEGRYVVFNPGHSPQWGTKRWPQGHWETLGCRLLKEGLTPLITGGGSDRELAEAIAAGIGPGGVSIAGRTDLPTLAGIMSLSRAVVSTDSGPMHVAAMAGARVVALFGPTNPVTSGPFGEGHRVLHHRLDCSLCFKKECPHQHRCLDGIGAEEAFSAVGEIMESSTSMAE